MTQSEDDGGAQAIENESDCTDEADATAYHKDAINPSQMQSKTVKSLKSSATKYDNYVFCHE